MQYNKAEVYGVNTAKLKVLTETEKQMLLQKIKYGTPAEKKKVCKEVISGNLKLTLNVIQRFTSRGEDLDNLLQVGYIGLMKTIDSFNPDLDVRSLTYEVPMIIGEIRRYLRDNNSVRVSRSVHDTAYGAVQMKKRMTAENEREPMVNEIAEALGLQCEEVVLALETIVGPVSLYEPVFSDGNDITYMVDQAGDKNDDSNQLGKVALREAISDLSDQEGRILSMRFFQGKTQVEVAGEIGISQARVSRLERGMLDKIKKEA